MKILVVDDEKALVDLISINLELEGYEVIVAYDGKEALLKIQEKNPNLVILDVMMPEMNGFEVLQNLQNKDIPVIVVTAKKHINDKLLGLTLGADDYITKPFDNRELMLRVKAILRRRILQKKDNREEKHIIKKGQLKLDKEKRIIEVNDKEVKLTAKEFGIVCVLAENYRKVFSREELLEILWGFDYIGETRTIDMHIRRIRKKLGICRNYIQTVFGVGYKMEIEEERN
ncbi:response regulator transcription factor [Clostridium sediminicola]|uniref:response regulator transcription factor n=1 Tax=Clostridium sediminicola TaxID=3114879 RepID=UPI0031F24A6D